MRQSIQEWTKQNFNNCLSQSSLGPFLNTLSHIGLGCRNSSKKVNFRLKICDLGNSCNKNDY